MNMTSNVCKSYHDKKKGNNINMQYFFLFMDDWKRMSKKKTRIN